MKHTTICGVFLLFVLFLYALCRIANVRGAMSTDLEGGPFTAVYFYLLL